MIGASRRPMRHALAAAALAACAAGPLAAQDRPEARVGDEVRVTTSAAGPGTVRGELVLVRNDSLYVRPGASRAVAVPLAAVQGIEVRHRRSWVEGVVFGVAIGAPAGGASGYLLGKLAESGPQGCGDDCGLLPAFGAAGGLLAGTVLGAIMGGSLPGGRWVPASRPGGGGVALSLEIRL